MGKLVPVLFAVTTALSGCGTPRQARLVLLDPSSGAGYVGAAVRTFDGLVTASIKIDGVFYVGKFDPSNSNAIAVLVGTGSALLHCRLHFDPRSGAGGGECREAGHRRFDVTLSDTG